MAPRELSPELLRANTQLQKETLSLLEKNEVSVSNQRLYKWVEFLCKERYQSKLTMFLYAAIKKFIENRFNDFIVETSSSENVIWKLEAFIRFMDSIDSKVSGLVRFYVYLDRTYLLNHPTKNTIKDYSLDLIGHIFHEKNPDVGGTILNAFLEILNEARITLDTSLLNIISSSYNMLKAITPEDLFINNIEQQSESFYYNHHLKLLSMDNKDKIFVTMNNEIMYEVQLWSTIDPKLDFAFKKIVIKNLLFSNFDEDSSIFIKPLLVNKQFQLVSSLFKFIKFDHEDEKKPQVFGKIWFEYLLEYISEFITVNHQDKDLISKLITTRKQFNLIVSKFLLSDQNLEYNLRDAFQKAIESADNVKSNFINSKLLKFIDSFFKVVSETATTHNEQVLEDVMLVIKSIKSKENFIKNYKYDLAKRLISSSTRNIRLEESLILLMQSDIDTEIIAPLNYMIQDHMKAKELQKQYLNQLPSQISLAFEPLMLKSYQWPSQISKVNLPGDLSELLHDFEKFYLSKCTSTVRLKPFQFSPAQSPMTIEWALPNGRSQTLELSTAQGIVLLLFNDSRKLKYDEIYKMSGLDAPTCAGVTHSLNRGKYKLLVQDLDGYYSVNEEFNVRKGPLRVRLSKMQKSTAASGNDEIQLVALDSFDSTKLVDEDILKAFIVRSLKNSIFMDHEELVLRCLERFIVERELIKKAVEALIDADYIRRDGPSRYVYIPE